jgi:hypothetical protein
VFGGHIHISEYNVDLIRYMDLYLGVPSILMDTDTRRRELYGKAGAYREKPWGLEYRVLSNFWYKTPELIGWVWDQCERATEADHPVDWSAVRSIIDTGDITGAKELCYRYNLEVVTC